MKVFEFTGDITFDDFVQMNRYHLREVFPKKTILIITILSFLSIIGLNVYNFIKNGYLSFFADILPIFIFILIWFFVWFLLTHMPKISFKKYYETDKIIKEKRTFCIDENTINIQGESFSNTLSKDKINKIKNDNDTIYIFTSNNALHMIKKRYLKDENEYNELKTFLETNYINNK